MSEFVQVGRVKDAHGIKGEIFITLFAGEAAWLDQLKEVRLVVYEEGHKPTEAEKAIVPEGAAKVYQVKSARLHKNGLIVKSSEITDRNAAENLKGLFLEIPREFLISAPGEELYLAEVEGFQVITKHKGEVGPIVGFSSNGEQDLLIVETSWGEFEIPFVKAFVENIDFKGRKIYLDLPVGLLGELEDEEAVEEDSTQDTDADEN
jgi:16S rRNA processing protein RimM